jgi:hypothetical protein
MHGPTGIFWANLTPIPLWQRAHDDGVRNMEMESPLFGAFTHRLGIRAACVWSAPRALGRPHATAHTRVWCVQCLQEPTRLCLGP